MVASRVVSLFALLLAVISIGCATEGGGDDPIDDIDGGGDEVDAGTSQSEVPTFMEPCDVADDTCEEPYFCFNFNMRGPHCTKECTLDTDCEAPSRGCNNMGVCKSP